jgi:DNA-directed RNA polymerase specialized sigma24 family protein
LTVDEWCKTNYNNLLQSSKNISYNSELSEELCHYAIEALLTKPNVQEIIDSGGATFWVIRVMLNSYRSTTSQFFKLYRGHFEQISLESYLSDETDIEDQAESETEETAIKIRAELAKIYWYDRELFNLYTEGSHTISSLARETKIPRTSISLTINRVRSHIKSQIK